ncbi:MAG TPA: uroporphyrinogen-III synthase, partial [Spirochaetia bacterium]|nr:uroporphyrinogen-III synthase [Spirochaetia bacterium]
SAGATRILAEAHAPSPNGHPLKDKRVLVTRPREQASELVSLLCAHGAIPLLLPLIRVEPAGETSRIEAALEGLSTYDWVIFTSSNGVEHFFSHLGKRPFSQKTAAVGPATSQALFARGITPGFVPSEHTGSALARGLHEREAGTLEGKRFLMPCAAQHNEEAARVLRAAGATVDELPVYRTVSEEPTLADLEAIDGDIDAVLFLSSSAVRSFQALTATTPSLAAALSRAVVACIGPSTAETARDAGMRVDLVSSEHTSKALVLALEERFR